MSKRNPSTGPSHSNFLGMEREGGFFSIRSMHQLEAPPSKARANLGVPLPILPGAGRCALRSCVAGQLREGAHGVRGGPYTHRAAAATGGAPARALQLLAVG